MQESRRSGIESAGSAAGVLVTVQRGWLSHFGAGSPTRGQRSATGVPPALRRPAPSAGPAPVFCRNLCDDPARQLLVRTFSGVRGEDEQGLPQGPAAGTCPGGLIGRERPAERLPAFSREERPGDDQIAGGVADGASAEVDDRAETALPDEKIACGDVAMHPDGGGPPGCRQGCGPDGARFSDIDRASQRVETLPGLGIVDAERSAAKETVRPGRWADGGNPLQGDEKFREADRETAQIEDAFPRRGLAFEPALDR